MTTSKEHPASNERPYPYVSVVTPTATWVYDLQGGGFASLLDPQERDWISFSKANGPAGEFRGIPNMVFRGPEKGFFHPGHEDHKASASTWEQQPDGTVLITSVADDGRRAVRWVVGPEGAWLTVETTNPEDPGYWFLYEGTPGGTFDPEASRVIFPGGESLPLTADWERDLGADGWVAFTDPEGANALLLWVDKEPGQFVDSYYPMNPMTVFGFGRERPSVRNLITTVPRRFGVALMDTVDREALAVKVAAMKAVE